FAIAAATAATTTTATAAAFALTVLTNFLVALRSSVFTRLNFRLGTITIVATIGFDVVIAFVAIVRLVVHDPERILRIARRNAAFDRLDAAIARLRLLVAAFAILLREQTVTRHRRRHDAVIMLCVLQEVLVSHTVAARLGVARVLRVLLVNLS